MAMLQSNALQLAAASDLGLGGQLADAASEAANALKKKKKPGDQNSDNPFMGWGGSGSRNQMYGAAGLDLGF